MVARWQYFVSLAGDLYALERVARSPLLRLPTHEDERRAPLVTEVDDLARKLGFSERRRANMALAKVGLPEVTKDGRRFSVSLVALANAKADEAHA